MNFITRYYREWSERRFLKRHGCETREEYDHRYDPDIVHRASRVKNFYKGYPYVHCFEDRQHIIYHWDLGYDGIWIATQWCKENLKGKYRFDFHRVIKEPSTANEWEVNELGGGDYIFFACQDPKDFTLFLLRWS
jgi:hypothetical protein